MEGTVVFVPVHLDAFLAREDTANATAHADFGKLPYIDSDEGDINPNHPYLSESITAEPFQNRSGILKKGLHLHWSLPDYLTKGEYLEDPSDTQSTKKIPTYPNVPTRWLLTRKREGLDPKRWVIESDYLHPEGELNRYNAISYPVHAESGQPYRYLGRQQPFEEWDPNETVERLLKLTALGYGEPTFAAFYPNCHSVFGFYDDSITSEEDLNGLTYELVGWYPDAVKDPIVAAGAAYREFADENESSFPGENAANFIQDHFGWQVTLASDNWPEGMACFAKLEFDPNATINNEAESSDVKISVGNSGTEALSAFLSYKNGGADLLKFEEQLERLLLQDDLKGLELDLGYRFREARHRKGFKPGYGSDQFVLSLPQEKRFVPTQISLPLVIATQLDELNEARKEETRLKGELARLRHLLYADWYKYMLSAYPEMEIQDQYPDLDEIKFQMENEMKINMASLENEIQIAIETLSSAKKSLNQTLESFVSGTLSKACETRLFDKQKELASHLTFHGENEALWVDNDPFSAKCLYFHYNYLSIVNQHDDLRGMSLWVKLATGNPSQATLIYTKDPLRSFARQGVSNFWNRVVINRHEQSVDREVTWNSLPKDQWTYLYLEFRRPLNKGETIYLFGYDEYTMLKGELAGLRFFSDGLTPNELDHDRNMLGHAIYNLNEAPGARFWEPKEPVILLEGEAVEPSLRHGHDRLHDESEYLFCPSRQANIETSAPSTSFQETLQEVFEEVESSEIATEPEHQYPPPPTALDASGGQDRMENVIDDNLSTSWQTFTIDQSNKSPETLDQEEEWIEFSWNDAQVLNHIEIIFLHSGKSGRKIQAKKSDDQEWVDLFEIAPEQVVFYTGSATRIYADFENNQAYSHYRFFCLGQVTIVTMKFSLVKPEPPQVIKTGHWKWTQQPWHPLMMEWETILFPATNGGNLGNDSRLYEEDFVTRNYTLARDEPECSSKENAIELNGGHSYVGRSILTPYAKRQFQHVARKELNQLTLSNQNRKSETWKDWIEGKPELPDWYRSKVDEQVKLSSFEQWYLERPVDGEEQRFFSDLSSQQKATDFHYSLILALKNVADSHCISQALGGFNAALLMHRHGLQIPIEDPLGFDDHRTFVKEVAQRLDGHTRWGCTPRSAFHPIRNGVLRIEQLHLIDTFGRIKADTDLQKVIKAEPMTFPEKQPHATNDLWLSPRLVQAARIDFRWLDVTTQVSEVNSHPSSSPIMGWVLYNHLDENLMIYDRHGRGLGRISTKAVWQALPGTDKPEDFQNIDPKLRAVIEKLCVPESENASENQINYLEAFSEAVGKAITFIEPESSVYDDGLAHLIGHPIAITRAFIQLKLDKPPVVDHSWVAFHHYLNGGERMTDDFEKVQIPVRIGESDRLNDGVVGYWLEEEGELGHTFHALAEEVKAFEDGEELISPYDPEQPSLLLNPEGLNKEMTILMDPRGNVHAVSGILPVKTIDIPDRDFMDTLKKVSTGMFHTRILTPKEKLQLPLRHESGHEWAWLQKDRFQWIEKSELGIVEKSTMISEFKFGEQLWDHLQEQNWIHLISDDRAKIVATDERKAQELEVPFESISGQVQQWLHQCELSNTTTEANFFNQLLIKEGWLQLQMDHLGSSADSVLYGGSQIEAMRWQEKVAIESPGMKGDFGRCIDLTDDWMIVGGGSLNGVNTVEIYQKVNDTWELYGQLSPDANDKRGTFGTKVFINQNWAFISTPYYDGPDHQYLYHLKQGEESDGEWTWQSEISEKAVLIGFSWVDHLAIDKDWMLAAGSKKDGEMGYSFYKYRNNQWQEVTASGESGAKFHGLQVTLLGNWALMGLPNDNAKGTKSGTAVIYKFDGNTWKAHQELVGDEWHAEESSFGFQVALGKEWAIIGSPLSKGSQGGKTGAAYAYQLISGRWVLRQTLQPYDLKNLDRYGVGVQVDNDQLVIHTAEASGGRSAIYYYHLESGIWVQFQKTQEHGLLYHTMAIDGTELVIGNRTENQSGSIRVLRAVSQEDIDEENNVVVDD